MEVLGESGGFRPCILHTELSKGPLMKDDGAVVSSILAAMYEKLRRAERTIETLTRDRGSGGDGDGASEQRIVALEAKVAQLAASTETTASSAEGNHRHLLAFEAKLESMEQASIDAAAATVAAAAAQEALMERIAASERALRGADLNGLNDAVSQLRADVVGVRQAAAAAAEGAAALQAELRRRVDELCAGTEAAVRKAAAAAATEAGETRAAGWECEQVALRAEMERNGRKIWALEASVQQLTDDLSRHQLSNQANTDAQLARLDQLARDVENEVDDRNDLAARVVDLARAVDDSTAAGMSPDTAAALADILAVLTRQGDALAGAASVADLTRTSRRFEEALNQAVEAGLGSGVSGGVSSSVVVSSIYGRVQFKCVGVDERSEEGLTLHGKAVLGVSPEPPGRENLGPGWHPRRAPLGTAGVDALRQRGLVPAAAGGGGDPDGAFSGGGGGGGGGRQGGGDARGGRGSWSARCFRTPHIPLLGTGLGPRPGSGGGMDGGEATLNFKP